MRSVIVEQVLSQEFQHMLLIHLKEPLANAELCYIISNKLTREINKILKSERTGHIWLLKPMP